MACGLRRAPPPSTSRPAALRLERDQDAPALQQAGPPDRPLPDPPRARRHRRSACGSSSAFWGATRVHVESAGIDDGRALTPEAAEELDIRITLDSTDELFRSDLQIDGVSVLEDLEPEADGRTLRIRPAELVETELVEQALAEGEHRIELSVGRMFLGDSTFTWSYVVDSIAPTLDVPASLDAGADRRARHDRGRGGGGRGAPARRRADRQRRRLLRRRLRLAAHRFARVRGDRRSGQPHAEARRGAGRLPETLARRARERARPGPTTSSAPASRT